MVGFSFGIRASPSDQIAAPSSTTSLIRNCPTAPEGNPPRLGSALTALFQANSIRLSRRRARRAWTSVSVYAAPTEATSDVVQAFAAPPLHFPPAMVESGTACLNLSLVGR